MKSEKYKKIVKEIIKDVNKSNLKVKLVNSKDVYSYDGDYSLTSKTKAWFDPSDPRCAIMVATKRKQFEWFNCLVHEYAHFKFWKEGFDYDTYDDAMNDIENWVNFKIELPTERIYECVSIIQNEELRTEKRTIELFEHWKIHDKRIIRNYIKGANAYVIGWNFIPIFRKWWDKSPFSVDVFVKFMPDKFLDDYTYAHVPHIRLYYEYCIKKDAPYMV